VDLKINSLIESGEIERPKVTQKVDPIKRPQPGGGVFAMTQENPGETREGGEGSVEPKARQQFSPLSVSDLGGVLAKVNRRSSRALAMKSMIDLWSGSPENSPLLNDMDDDQAFFKVAARQNGLLMHRVEGDLDSILKLNLPAVLEFYLQGGGTPRYLTSKINGMTRFFRAVEKASGGRDQLMPLVPWRTWRRISSIPPTCPFRVR
jgi:hypothetical protein